MEQNSERPPPYTDPYTAGYDQPDTAPTAAPTVAPGSVELGSVGPTTAADHPPAYPGYQPPTNTVGIVQEAPVNRKSYAAHIIFSCVVFWCCFTQLALIAWLLAVAARHQSKLGDQRSARRFGVASVVFSFLAIVGGIVILVLIVVHVKKLDDGVTDVDHHPSYIFGPGPDLT